MPTERRPIHWHMAMFACHGVAVQSCMASARTNRPSPAIDERIRAPNGRRPQKRDGQNSENIGTLAPKTRSEIVP